MGKETFNGKNFRSLHGKEDVLLVADCVGYFLGDFHKECLKSKSLVIACPKLDSDQDIYLQKLTSMMQKSTHSRS